MAIRWSAKDANLFIVLILGLRSFEPTMSALRMTTSRSTDNILGMFLEERTAVAITTSDAERLARELYGLGASAAALPGEYDSNFLLHAGDDREFVLKCMHPARENAFIDMQSAALTHLATHAPHLQLPRVQRNNGGDLFARVTDSAGQ